MDKTIQVLISSKKDKELEKRVTLPMYENDLNKVVRSIDKNGNVRITKAPFFVKKNSSIQNINNFMWLLENFEKEDLLKLEWLIIDFKMSNEKALLYFDQVKFYKNKSIGEVIKLDVKKGDFDYEKLIKFIDYEKLIKHTASKKEYSEKTEGTYHFSMDWVE